MPKMIKMTMTQRTRNSMWSNSFAYRKQGISSHQTTMWNPTVQKTDPTNQILIGSKNTIDYTNPWKDCRWMMLKDFMMRFNKILTTSFKLIRSLKISIMQTSSSLLTKSWNFQTLMTCFRYPILKIRSPKNNKSSLIWVTTRIMNWPIMNRTSHQMKITITSKSTGMKTCTMTMENPCLPQLFQREVRRCSSSTKMDLIIFFLKILCKTRTKSSTSMRSWTVPKSRTLNRKGKDFMWIRKKSRDGPRT